MPSWISTWEEPWELDVVAFISFAPNTIQGYDAWWAGVRTTPLGILELDDDDVMEVSSTKSSNKYDDEYYVSFDMPTLDIPPPPPMTSTSTSPVDPSQGIQLR